MLNYLILGALFFVLSPGNFLTLPRGGSKMTVALVHAVVFVVAYYLFQMFVVNEGFQGASLDEDMEEDMDEDIEEGFQKNASVKECCECPKKIVRSKF